jgi:hypothetical protein
MKRTAPALFVAAAALLPRGAAQSPPRSRTTEAPFYVADSLTRIGPTDAPPQNRTTRAFVSAAANEYEAFQVVVMGGAAGLRGVDATVEGPLRGESGSAIAPENIQVYREHYVTITSPSNRGAGGARAGTYPDALIPLRNPFTGEPLSGGALAAAPFDVAAGQNQPLYVEVLVPAGTPAGVYSGGLRLTRAGGQLLGGVAVNVTVWDFELPRTPSLRSAFQDYDADRLADVATYYGYPQDSPQHLAAARAMDEQLIAHRLTPASPGWARLRVANNGNLVSDPEVEQRIEALLSRPEYGTYELYFKPDYPFADPLGRNRQRALTYLRQAHAWLASRGFLPKTFLRQLDEPTRESDFVLTRQLAELVHEASPEFRVAITTDFSFPYVAQDLYGFLDILIVGNWTFDPQQAAQRLAAGDEIWTYTALVQEPGNPSPFWQIEFPLLNYRITPWMSHRYGLKGLQYWTTAHWEEIRSRGGSPWMNPCSYRSGSVCYNGDGLLVYPGREINYRVPAGAYGGESPAEVFGPAPSLRLKALRDGMEDYELLVLAEAKDQAATRQTVIEVACAGNADSGDAVRNCFHAWSMDPQVLLRARERLAAIAGRR